MGLKCNYYTMSVYRALGTLNPVIYFENSRGHILLPPEGIGEGPGLARKLFEERYKAQGYEWHEAGTLNDVDKLQRRLVKQESDEQQGKHDYMMGVRSRARSATASNLRQRMISADCSPYERDFIKLWLEMDEEKRKKYSQRWDERNMYLWGREMDAGTKVEDRMGS